MLARVSSGDRRVQVERIVAAVHDFFNQQHCVHIVLLTSKDSGSTASPSLSYEIMRALFEI